MEIPLRERGWVIYAGRRGIVQETRDKFKIFLPKNLNDLWRELKGKKVKVYLVVDVEDSAS